MAVNLEGIANEQQIDVGPMSGKSNVIFWLQKRGIEATDEIVDRIFAEAKQSDCVLSDDAIRAVMRREVN